MMFNDVTNKTGLCQEIDSLCDSNTTSYSVADKARRVNAAQDELIGEIITADGTWQYDDSNYTDEPIGTANLQEGISKYTFADEFLDIKSVKVLDLNGIYILIKPLDETELGGISVEEYFGNTSGIPTHYDKLGNTVRLYPTPATANVTLTAGLKVEFQRKSSHFTASDTTKEPGIPSIYHPILAYMASIPYCMSYKKDRVALYEKKKDEMKKSLLAHFGRREKDKRKVMTMAQRPFR